MSSIPSQHIIQKEIVRAGAGAGKTYTLTHKVMNIADDWKNRQNRYPRVVVTTFTRKATQELRERLMLLAIGEKPHLVDFVNSRSQLVISTIHGVLDLFLRRYGSQMNLDPGYTILAPLAAAKLARTTLRSVVFSDATAADLLEVLPFARLVDLLRKIDQAKSDNPAAQPFGPSDIEKLFSARCLEMAHELRSVAEQIKEESSQSSWLKMGEEFSELARILTSQPWAQVRLAFLDRFESLKAARWNKKSPPVSEETAGAAKKIRENLKELKEPLFDPEFWSMSVDVWSRVENLAIEFSKRFREIKRQRASLEISDLENFSMDCMRQFPETVDSFQAEWDYWLIDEYQDTSPFQVALVEKLAAGRPSFIVGDPQQSIYLFRGALEQVFCDKEQEVQASGGSCRVLPVNRRSHPELLHFINDFFSHFDPPFSAMEAFVPEGVSVDPSKIVTTVYCGDVKDQEGEEGGREREVIASYVQSLILGGARPEDICVLGRTNQTLRDVAEGLSRFGVPTHVHVASGFYERRETRDALALLRFFIHPHNNFNLIELLRSPWFRMPDDNLAEIASKKQKSLWCALTSEPSGSAEYQCIARLQRYRQTAMKEGFSGALLQAMVESGFIDLSHLHDVTGRREANFWKLLARLEKEESKAGFNPLEFVEGAAQSLIVDGDQTEGEGDAVGAVEPDRVNLMTVHASKGLEFRHVIIPSMQRKPQLTYSEPFTYDEGLGRWALRVPFGADAEMTKSLPEVIYLENLRSEELKENCRVLYVAMTRAIESLFLSWTAPVQKDSWAANVNLNLEPGEHRRTHYTYKVTDSMELSPTVSNTADTFKTPRSKWNDVEAASVNQSLLNITEPSDLNPWGSQQAKIEYEVAQPESVVSVSEILGRKSGVSLISRSKEQSLRRVRASSRGTAMHRLMEFLKYPSREHFPMLIKKWFPQQESQVLRAIEFVETLRRPPLMEIIRNGSVEWGFVIRPETYIIDGQVDLWGRTDGGELWIIDYKTGNPNDYPRAFEQMAIYSQALRMSGEIRASEAIHSAAIYPFERLVHINENLF